MDNGVTTPVHLPDSKKTNLLPSPVAGGDNAPPIRVRRPLGRLEFNAGELQHFAVAHMIGHRMRADGQPSSTEIGDRRSHHSFRSSGDFEIRLRRSSSSGPE